MKKTFILTFALLLAFVVAHAQTEKGTQTIGIDLQYLQQSNNQTYISPGANSLNVTGSKYKSFNVGPQYSYFIAKGLDLGGSINYASNSVTYPQGSSALSSQVSKGYQAAIYLRRYLMFDEKIGLRVGPNFNYGHSNATYTYYPSGAENDYQSKTDEYSGGLTAEFLYYPTKHLGLSVLLANVGYSYSTTNNGSQGDSNQKNFNLDLINSHVWFSMFYSFGGK